jgi:hypothetical protein
MLYRLTALWTTDRIHARQPRLFLIHLKPDCHRPYQARASRRVDMVGRRGLFNRRHGSA